MMMLNIWVGDTPIEHRCNDAVATYDQAKAVADNLVDLWQRRSDIVGDPADVEIDIYELHNDYFELMEG